MYMLNSLDAPASFGIREIFTGFGHNTTSPKTISSWGSAQTNDMLVVLWCIETPATATTSSTSWVKVGSADAAGSDGKLCAFAGVFGTAASTLSVTATDHSAWIVYVISGATTSTSDVKIATATGSFSALDPPSLNPAQGAVPHLWIASAGGPGYTLVSTAGPSGFTNFTESHCSTSGGSGAPDVAFASASLLDSASTKDPGTFNGNTSQFWSALTVSVLGA